MAAIGSTVESVVGGSVTRWTCVVPTRSLGWLQLGHWVGPWNVRTCPIPWLKGIRTKSQSCIRVHSWDQGLKACLQGHGWACHLLGSWSGRTTPGPGLSGARATCCFRLCNQTEFDWPAFRGIEDLVCGWVSGQVGLLPDCGCEGLKKELK